MHDDEYLALETQYDALVESVSKCQETLNQLNNRIDQQSVRIFELESKINMLKAGFPVW